MSRLTKLEDWHIVDVFPYPPPVLRRRIYDIASFLNLPQGINPCIGDRVLDELPSSPNTSLADWNHDFATPRTLADFKVADLACGTGTLLMAAAQTLTDRYIQDRAAQDLSLTDKDFSILHRTLMQNILHGYHGVNAGFASA